MLRSLLPPDVLVAEADPREASLDALLPAERACVERAVDKRRREFAAVRALARPLLRDLGAPPGFALLPGPDRAPVWPPGVVGSITHCATLAGVAVARDGLVGIDVELDGALPDGVEAMVLTPTEQRALGPEPGWRGRLVFSAKEAAYKAIYPVTREFLDFPAMVVTVGEGAFRATLQQRSGPFPAGYVLHGRWRREAGLIATAVR